MTVCRFYQQGNCRFGDNCKFEHPGAQGRRNAVFATQNRFSAFQSPAASSGDGGRKDQLWSINVTDIEYDLTAGKGRPQWILSTYGPNKNAPASLFDGNELSFEELRLRFYELKAAGNEMQAITEANGLWSMAEQQMADVRMHANKVVAFMEEADKKHPNRYDFCKMTGQISKEQVIKEVESSNQLGGTNSAFGAPAPALQLATSTGVSGFGATTTAQASQPAFGQPSFGQPAATSTTSTASTFGMPGGGTFGQPSAFGQALQPSGLSNSPFGQPGRPNPFANPSASAFGLPAQPASTFGQPSQPKGFGQLNQTPSAFGQPSQPGNGFGKISQPTPAFGQSSQLGSSFTGGSNAFIGFGQSSNPAPPAFGAPSQPTPAFGQPTQPTPSLGQATQSNLGSNQPSQPGTDPKASNLLGGGGTDPFGRSAQPAFGSTTDRPNPFINPTTTAPHNYRHRFDRTSTTRSSIFYHDRIHNYRPSFDVKPPSAVHYTQTLPRGRTQNDPVTKRLTLYNSRPVKYINEMPCYQRPDGKGWERIWFPNGVDPAKLEDVQPSEEKQTDQSKHGYRRLAETGKFETGNMPLVAPMREWVSFDF